MATEELKQVTVFMAGLGAVDMRTRMPYDAIVKEMRGSGRSGEEADVHPVEAIFVGVNEMDAIVNIHLQRHNILGYVIQPYVKSMISRPGAPGGLSSM